MKKRILVPTDFSSNADDALRYAFNFGKYVGADELHLLHSAYIPVNPADTIVSVSQVVLEDSEKLLRELEKKISTWPESKGFSIRTETTIEDVVTAVKNRSRDLRPDYIIMGTKGSSGVEEFLFGTTAADVLESSDLPVLVIPSKTLFSVPKEVVFAADLKGISNAEVLAPLKNLVIGFESKLVLLHVSSEINLNAMEEHEKTELLEYFRGLDVQFKVLHSESIYTGIEVYLQDNEPEMLCVLSRKHNFFQRLFRSSVSKKIAHRTIIPLLSMRE